MQVSIESVSTSCANGTHYTERRNDMNRCVYTIDGLLYVQYRERYEDSKAVV